jgi:hypothetical protein
MSSGERALQNIMSWIYYLGTVQPCLSSKEMVPRENILLLLDEMDLSLHPSWQRDYIYYLIKLINTAYRDKKVQIIMTTHSPLCLSDIPGANVIYLKKTDEGTRIYNERHKETFAANIYELLNDSFYLGNLTMGRFAQNYIKELIRELDIVDKNNAIGDENYNIYRKRIDIIGDKLIKQKLHDKLRRRYGEINGREAYLRRLDAEINRLEKEKDRVLRKIDSD